MIFLTWTLQDPQVDPALVSLVTSAWVEQPLSAAPLIWPLVTLLQEQTTASSGSSSLLADPPDPAGRIRSSGLSGSGRPLATIGRRMPYALASPTSTPPRRRLPSSEMTSFL